MLEEATNTVICHELFRNPEVLVIDQHVMYNWLSLTCLKYIPVYVILVGLGWDLAFRTLACWGKWKQSAISRTLKSSGSTPVQMFHPVLVGFPKFRWNPSTVINLYRCNILVLVGFPCLGLPKSSIGVVPTCYLKQCPGNTLVARRLAAPGWTADWAAGWRNDQWWKRCCWWLIFYRLWYVILFKYMLIYRF